MDELDDEILGSSYDARVVRRLAGYLRPHGPRLALGVILILGITGLEILGPIIVRFTIDQQIAQGRTALLGLAVTAYVATLVGLFVLRYTQTLQMTYVGQRVMAALGRELFTHLQHMSVAFFDRNPVGRLVLYVCGYRDARRQDYSDKICTALQLANFWQDVRRDLVDLGRIYVPLE